MVDGGAGEDILTGGKATSFIAGGTGSDPITGGTGMNWIIGDSAFDVDYLLRTVIIDDSVLSAAKDFITGGANADVILGDHGLITQAGFIDGTTTALTAGVLNMMSNHDVIRIETTTTSGGWRR